VEEDMDRDDDVEDVEDEEDEEEKEDEEDDEDVHTGFLAPRFIVRHRRELERRVGGGGTSD
jgi:hypothetical protein